MLIPDHYIDRIVLICRINLFINIPPRILEITFQWLFYTYGFLRNKKNMFEIDKSFSWKFLNMLNFKRLQSVDWIFNPVQIEIISTRSVQGTNVISLQRLGCSIEVRVPRVRESGKEKGVPYFSAHHYYSTLNQSGYYTWWSFQLWFPWEFSI